MNDLQNLIATILGSLLVLVAIWLIAVRRDSGRNHIKTPFGELDLSTPGLAVLVVGAGLLLAPAFLPHRPGGLPSFISSGDNGDSPETVLRRRPVLRSEEEPNDNADSANLIELEQTVTGRVGERKDELDHFAFSTAPGDDGPKRIILRTRKAGGCCAYLTVWDENEETIARGSDPPGETISVAARAADSYLIRVTASPGIVLDYELVARQEPQ